MSRNLAKALCAAVSLLTGAIPAGAPRADAMYSEAAPSRSIAVPKDKSLSFRLDEPATKIVVAQPDVAEVVAPPTAASMCAASSRAPRTCWSTDPAGG